MAALLWGTTNPLFRAICNIVSVRMDLGRLLALEDEVWEVLDHHYTVELDR